MISETSLVVWWADVNSWICPSDNLIIIIFTYWCRYKNGKISIYYTEWMDKIVPKRIFVNGQSGKNEGISSVFIHYICSVSTKFHLERPGWFILKLLVVLQTSGCSTTTCTLRDILLSNFIPNIKVKVKYQISSFYLFEIWSSSWHIRQKYDQRLNLVLDLMSLTKAFWLV